MASIKRIRASDGTGSASAATVTASRSPGATTLQVNTVDNIPAYFSGAMGTPHTFTDPVTSETITVISEATCVEFQGHVSSTNLEIDSIDSGFTDLGSSVGDVVIIKPTTGWANNVADILDVSHDDDGTLKTGAVTTAKIADDAVTAAKLAAGAAVQVAYTETGAVATGTTLMFYDDTIPQSNEGDQYMTLSFTPKSATNILKIEVLGYFAHSVATSRIIGALFIDSGADAVAAAETFEGGTAGATHMLPLRHMMVAGTTSAMTFKFRAGGASAGTLAFNGTTAGSRRYGGITLSSIVITEYKA